MKSSLKIYTSFVSPATLKEFMAKGLLPIFIIRNIKTSELIGDWSDTPVHYKDLSPTSELFRLKRDKKITVEEFQKRYAIEISHVNLESVLRNWELLCECSGARGIVLLGYGSDDKVCHRSTLRTIINNSALLEEPIKEVLL